MALLDDYLADINSNPYGGSGVSQEPQDTSIDNMTLDSVLGPQQPNPLDTKVGSTEVKALDKEAELDKKASLKEMRVAYIHDGDTPYLYDPVVPEEERQYVPWRVKGYDAYETDRYDYKPGTKGARGQESRLDRQLKRLNLYNGSDDAKEADILNRGRQDTLKLYNRLTGQDYVDPYSVDTSAGSFNLGDKEHPLDLPVYVPVNARTGKFERSVGPVYTKDEKGNMHDIADTMATPYNISMYDDRGHYSPIKTADRFAEITGWQGTKPSKMKDPQEIERFKAWSDKNQGYMDALKSEFKSGQGRTGAQILNLAKAADEATGHIPSMIDYMKWFGDKLGLTDEPKGAKKNQTVMQSISQERIDKALDKNTGQKFLDQRSGLSWYNRDRNNRKQAKAEKAFNNMLDNGVNTKDFTTFLKEGGSAMPDILADSGAEMGLLMSGGAPALAFARTMQQDKSFQDANGRHLTTGESVALTEWNLLNLYAEKLGIEKGLTKIGQSMIKRYPGIARIVSIPGAATVGAIGEGIQETSENAADQAATTKVKPGETLSVADAGKAFQDKQVLFGGALGALTGGALAGGVNTAAQTTAGAAQAVPAAYKKAKDTYTLYRNDKGKREELRNMSDTEFNLKLNDIDTQIGRIEDASKALDDFVMSVDNIREPSEIVDTKVEAVDSVLDDVLTKTAEENVEKGNVSSETLGIIQDVLESTNIDDLRDELDVPTTMSNQEVLDTVKKDPLGVFKKVYGEERGKALIENEKNVLIDNMKNNIDEHGILESVKKQMQEKADEVKEDNRKTAELYKKIKDEYANIRQEESENISYERKDESVDLNSMPEVEKSGIVKRIYDSLPFTSKETKESKREAKKQLSSYSDASLNDFIAAENERMENSPYAKIAQDIINDRQYASDKGNIYKTYDYETDNTIDKEKDLTFSNNDKKSNYAKIRRLVSQKSLDSQGEYDRLAQSIDALLQKGHITDTQAALLHKRLSENKSNINPEQEFIYKDIPMFKNNKRLKADLKEAKERLKKAQNKYDEMLQDPSLENNNLGLQLKAIKNIEEEIENIKREIGPEENGSQTEQKEKKTEQKNTEKTEEPQPTEKPVEKKETSKKKIKPKDIKKRKTELKAKFEELIRTNKVSMQELIANGMDLNELELAPDKDYAVNDIIGKFNIC